MVEYFPENSEMRKEPNTSCTPDHGFTRVFLRKKWNLVSLDFKLVQNVTMQIFIGYFYVGLAALFTKAQ